MKRVMIVGPTGSGKTSLLKALGIWGQDVRKTEAVSFGDEAVDTPGEFFDMPRFYHTLITTSVNSGVSEIHAVSSLRGDGMEELGERVRKLRTM